MKNLTINYRNLYSELTKMDIEDFDIHHIDRDKTNNDIINLVALPSELHRIYHALIKEHKVSYLDLIEVDTDPFLIQIKYETDDLKIKVLNKCSEYLIYRNSLLVTNKIFTNQWKFGFRGDIIGDIPCPPYGIYKEYRDAQTKPIELYEEFKRQFRSRDCQLKDRILTDFKRR